MPTYGYKCNQCNHTFEVFQKITDEPLTTCTQCESEVHRILYPVGIVFKGSGFHINDYRKADKVEKADEGEKEKVAEKKPETVEKTKETAPAASDTKQSATKDLPGH